MNNTSTNDTRDSRALLHSAQRSKNPNQFRAVKMTPMNAPTTYDHTTTARDDSDAHSKRFIYTGVSIPRGQADHMSARRMAQWVMKGGN
jgi:hypothetical protein